VGSVGDKTPLLPPPGDGRKNLGCVRTLNGAVLLGDVRLLRASLLWCNSSCTTVNCTDTSCLLFVCYKRAPVA
jgi:hypothetical protein